MKLPATFARGRNRVPLSENDYATLAAEYGIEVAALKAFALVETGDGRGFRQNGDLKMLYEPHIAHRHSRGTKRAALVKAGLAHPRWGGIRYGSYSNQVKRLRAAAEIVGADAFEYASYGIGQVLGTNAEALGYKSAHHMFTEFLSGERAQLDGMLRFLKVNGLIEPLKRRDWHRVARGYNGPAYKTHNYHGRLANAYARFSGGEAVSPQSNSGVLTIGSRGDAVRALQEDLNQLVGAKLTVDGVYGRATRQAVEEAQEKLRITIDGIAGPQTLGAIKDALKPATKAEQPAPPKSAPAANSGGFWAALARILQRIFGGTS
jgi:hypothetical protein